MSGVLVIDVSSNNGPVNWRIAKTFGRVKAAAVKITEGVTYTSPTCAAQIAAARRVGLPVLLFHYARPDHNGFAEEARHFCAVAKAFGPLGGKFALDYETAGTLTRSEHFSWITGWNSVVKQQLGSWPMFYSYTSFIADLRLPRPVGNGLWLADYGRNDGKRHPASPPLPWQNVAMHQFTSNGRVTGVTGPVDVNWAQSLTAILAPPAL